MLILAATTAAIMGGCESLERKRAELKVRRVWAEIGFEPLCRNVMVLDLGKVTLGERLAALRSVFGAGNV